MARTRRDVQRWAGRGTTEQRGYGSEHQAERKRRLARWRPGDPCVRCGRPMFGPPAMIDLGHTADRTAYTGLEHRHCNRGEGARRGNRMRGQRRAVAKAAVTGTPAVTTPGPLRTSRQW